MINHLQMIASEYQISDIMKLRSTSKTISRKEPPTISKAQSEHPIPLKINWFSFSSPTPSLPDSSRKA